MFSPQFVSIENLSWVSIGPGPDPAVLVEARIVINDATFRLLGFRVPMPFSAGWTRSAYWEDDKGLHKDGLLWDVEGFRDFMQRVDSAPADDRGLTVESQDVMLHDDMQNLAAIWRSLSARLDWASQDWRPAIIDGQPYILIGYPEGPARDGLPVRRMSMAGERRWLGRPERQHHLNLRIHGGVCDIACVEVRTLSSDGQTAMRPMDASAADFVATTQTLIRMLPGGGESVPFRMDGRAMYGFILPVDVEAWSFDAEEFLTQASSGLDRNRLRWAFDLPLEDVDERVAEIVEGLASLVRCRNLSRSGDSIFVACSIDEAVQLLGAADRTDGSSDELKSMLYTKLGRLRLRCIGRREDDTLFMVLGRVAERMYLLADRFYLALTPPFLRLAAGSAAGDLLHLSEANVIFETALNDDPTQRPDWAADLPVMVDTPLRSVHADLESMIEDG